jgi:hypothetical protein
MAEHQLPKLTVRVRFPSSALTKTARSEVDSDLAVCRSAARTGRRAIRRARALRSRRRPLVVVLAALVVDVLVDGISNGLWSTNPSQPG